jgi:hypothetical protein
MIDRFAVGGRASGTSTGRADDRRAQWNLPRPSAEDIVEPH